MYVYLALVLSLWLIMQDVASNRTDKVIRARLTHDAVKSTIPELLNIPLAVANVAATFCEVAMKRELGSTVSVQGDSFAVREYRFPTHWWTLAQCRKVYVSSDAIGHAEPVLQTAFEWPYDAGLKLLTPDQVERFFSSFNIGQEEPGTRIALEAAPSTFSDCCSLSDFKYLMGSDGDWVSMNPTGGTIDGVVAQVLRYSAPFDSKYVVPTGCLDEEMVYKWLTLLA